MLSSEIPQSKSCNKYLIVFEDLFPRWVEVKPVPNATGIAVQKAPEHLVVFRWGILRRLIVDNGSAFDNKRIVEMVKCYGIQLLSEIIVRISVNSPVPPPSEPDGAVLNYDIDNELERRVRKLRREIAVSSLQLQHTIQNPRMRRGFRSIGTSLLTTGEKAPGEFSNSFQTLIFKIYTK